MVPVLAGDNWGNSLVVEGFEAGPDTNTNASFNGVGPGYFRTMGIPLMAGREFTRADAAGAPKVGIVNQAFAKKFNLGDNPIGKRFGLGGAEREAGHRDRRRRPGCEVQRREARGAAAVLPAVPAGRAPRLRLFLRSHRRRRRSRCSPRVPGDHAQARCEPAARRRQDDGDADSRERRARIASSARCRWRSRCSRRCSPRSASTACSPTPWRSARASSACAWRSAPTAAPCAALVMKQVVKMAIVGGVIGLDRRRGGRPVGAVDAVRDGRATIRWCSPARRLRWPRRARRRIHPGDASVEDRSDERASLRIRRLRSGGTHPQRGIVRAIGKAI